MTGRQKKTFHVHINNWMRDAKNLVSTEKFASLID